VLAACEAPKLPDKLVVTPARYSDLPGWEAGAPAGVLPALRRSCLRIARLPPQQVLGPEGAARPAGSWQAVCREAEALADNDDGATRAFFERRFVPFAASNNGDADGLFTGYYEPELRGARTRGGSFTVPLYGRPMDMINVDLGLFREEWRGRSVTGRVDGTTLKPYHDRAAIEGGAIAGKAPELVWVDDKVDAFFLQVQGSGRVTLDDGSVLRVGYAAQNGHPYVALTAGRSLAVDRSFVPYGTPLWLDAEDPLDPALRVRRLMVAQDTGGAIKGPVRGDVFWGYGAEAAERAGKMKSPGRYWLLVPRAESAGE
jgi:membrane-bound lytic murein transglycosylase A